MKKQWVKIPEVLFFQEGPGVRNTQYTDEGVKLLNVANLVDGKIDLSTSDRYISKEEAYGKYKHFLCNVGDFVIASSGIKVEYLDKKMGFITESMLPLCMNTSTIRFKVLDENELDIRYFMYYVKSAHFKRQVAFYITGSAQLNYGPSHLKKMVMPLIKLSEQKKIIEKLDKISQIISQRQQQLEKFDELIKARFVEMFGTLDLSIPGESWIALSELSTIFTGTTPSTKDDENWNGDILWITPAELSDNSFTVCDTERKITQKGMKSKSLSLMPKNTVLLSTRAPIGKVAITGIEMCCNQGFKNFYCDDSVLNPVYLYTLLRNNNEYLNSLGTGTTFKEISKTDVSKIKIPVADISFQNQFADFVKQVDKSKVVVQKALDEAQLLFDSKMQEYFG